MTAVQVPPPSAASRPARQAQLLAILPRGETLRNFVYSGALDQLHRDVGVNVLSVIPSSRVESLLRERYQGVWPLDEIRERWGVRFLRELLDLAHGRWLWSEAARERWRRRDLEAVTSDGRFKRTVKKALAFPFASRAGLALLSRTERLASRAFRTTDHYLRLLQELRPALVFNTSHVHSAVAVQAVQAAQWLGIPTATFIFSWDNLTSQGRILVPYDAYLVWNQDLRRQLLQMYPAIRPERVLVTGTPQFDQHFQPENHLTREEYCRQVGADPSRPIVLYSTGMPNHMPGEPDIVESIGDLLREPEFAGAQLLVRVYPKDRTNRFDDLRKRRPDILFPAVPWDPSWLTPLPEDGPLLTNTLRHAAVGINVASTVSLELCMFDKPVINVAYNPPGVPEGELSYARYYQFDHYRPIVESGAITLVRSAAAMRPALRAALERPSAQQAERHALMARMFDGLLDGRSAERVAATLLRLTRRGL